MGVPQREKGPHTILFNHGHYYSMISNYHLEWKILSNSFPRQKKKNLPCRPQCHNWSHSPHPSLIVIFSFRTKPSHRVGFLVQCFVIINALYLQSKFKLTHGWKVLGFYTLQTKPALQQARELTEFPKAFWGTSEMKRGSRPNIMDALYEIYICSLISQAVIESLPSVRQCSNAPGTEKKASRP